MLQRCRSRMKAKKNTVATSPITAYFKKLAPDVKPRKPQVKISPITSYFLKSKQAVENRSEEPSGVDSNKTVARNLSVEFLAQPDRKTLAALNTSPNSSQKSVKSCPTPLPRPNRPVVSPSLVSTTPPLLPPSELSALEDSPELDSFLFDVTTPQLPLVRSVPVPCSPKISTAVNIEISTMPKRRLGLEHDVIMVSDSPLLSVIDLTCSILPSPKRRCLVDLTESPMVILGSPTFQEPPHEGTGIAGADRVIPAMGNGGVSWGLDQQPPEITVTHTAREGKTKLSSSKVISNSLCAIAKGVEAFHLTSSASPKHGSNPDPPAILELESEHASSAQVRLHQAPPAHPLSSSALPSSELTSDIDVPDLLAPPISMSVKDELELLLWQRGAPYCKHCSPTQKVRLFGLSQDNMVENLMEVTSTVSSRKLHSVLEYLTILTSASFMPKASQLQRLWEMVADPHIATNYLSVESLQHCITFFRRLLSLHPPGQHPLVDTQYREFVRLLGQEGSPFAIWDSISTMFSGPESYAHLLCFLVDILLSDFWSCLSSAKEPLFVKVFWQGPDHGHITLPIRQLIDTTVRLAEKPCSRESEFSKLGSCTSLLFMATTRCQDLSTELTIACRRLPSDRLLLLLSHIQPTSLQVELVRQIAPSFQCTLSSVSNQLRQCGLPITSTSGPMRAHTQQQCRPEEVEEHLMSGHYPPSSRSDEVMGVTGGRQDPEVHSVPTKAELVPSATMMAQPIPITVVRTQPVSSAGTKAQPVPVTRAQLVSSAGTKAQPVPVSRAQPVSSAWTKARAGTKAQPVPVTRAQLVSRAETKAQPVSSAVVRTQPVSSAWTKAQPVSRAGTKAQPVPVTRAQLVSSAGTKAQQISRAGTKTQPMHSAGTMAQPMPITVVRTQPVSRVGTKPVSRAGTKAQPVHSAVVIAQPVRSVTMRAQPKKASSVQPTSTVHQTVPSNVSNLKAILALPRVTTLSSAERGPPVSSHQPKPKEISTQTSSVKEISHWTKSLSTIHTHSLQAKPFASKALSIHSSKVTAK